MPKTIQEKIKENRIIFITSSLNEKSTSNIIFDILKWSNESPKEKINIYLSSHTYDFINAIAIYDALETIDNPIAVYCIGSIGGFASLFLAIATKGERYALKNTDISLDQPYAFLENGNNQQTEVEIVAKEVKRERDTFEEILSEKFNKPIEVIHEDVEYDRHFTAKEALEYGLIDKILE